MIPLPMRSLIEAWIPRSDAQGERHPPTRFVNRATCFFAEHPQAAAKRACLQAGGDGGSRERVAVVGPEVGPHQKAEAT
jgi:hypothetical protein